MRKIPATQTSHDERKMSGIRFLFHVTPVLQDRDMGGIQEPGTVSRESCDTEYKPSLLFADAKQKQIHSVSAILRIHVLSTPYFLP